MPHPLTQRLVPGTVPAWMTVALLVTTSTAMPTAATASTGPEDEGGLAVAPMDALDMAATTAAILTGIVEGVAAQHAATDRFVAHGELLRTVDRGPEPGCRSRECLARAAAELGASHLLTGEVGRLGEARVVTVQLTRTSDVVTVSAASRRCEPCEEGALPALLDDALYELLAIVEQAEAQVSGDGRTIQLSLRRRAASADFLDRHRVTESRSVNVDGVQLSTLTRSGEQLGCLEPGEEIRFVTTLQAVNTGEAPVTLDGELIIEVLDDATGEVVLGSEHPVRQQVETDDGSGERFAEDGSWIPPVNVWKDTVELRTRATAATRLQVRVSWGEELLEDLVTRPVARVTRVDDLYLEHGGDRVQELVWGEPMAVHLVLTKLEVGAPAEVTLQLRRKLRYWFDTDDDHAFFAIDEGADGAYHLILPWTPALARRDATESVSVEVWINGCLLLGSPEYH